MAGVPLHLAVQYASVRPAPQRAQLRRWVRSALAVPVDPSTVGRAVPIDAATLTIRFVDTDEGRVLNRSYRGTDHATNVLTFPFDDVAADAATVEADIVICLPVVEAEAHAQSKLVLHHCAHLVVHGTLHACGYDHESEHEAAAMEGLERDILKRFGIVDPYRVVESAP